MEEETGELTGQIQQELLHAKQQQILEFRNEILLFEIKRMAFNTRISTQQLGEAIHSKYTNITDYMNASSFSISTINEIIDRVQEYRIEIPKKRVVLGRKITDYVKMILKLLDTTWSIMERFKYKSQKEKNIYFDEYYMSLVDTLLLKVKTLHLTLLISIYDEEFTSTLETIKDILEKRYLDSERTLKYTTAKLEEYNEFGLEFKTLSIAYKQLLDKIQSTKDDIDRIKRY